MAAGYEATEAVTALTHDAHWGDNIHKYGVVDGIGHSFTDAGSAFVKDNVETFDKVKNTVGDAAKSVWHGRWPSRSARPLWELRLPYGRRW